MATINYRLLDVDNVETADLDKVCWFEILGAGQAVEIGRHEPKRGQAALRAIGRVKLESYGPDVTVGHHPLNINEVIDGWCEEWAVDRNPNAAFGWSMVNLVDYQPRYADVTEIRAYAHDLADRIIQGKAMKVWVAPLRAYLASYLADWTMDLDDARESRNTKIENRIVQNAVRKVNAPLAANGLDVANPTQPAAPKLSLVVHKYGGGRINLYTVKKDTVIGFMAGDTEVQSLPWNPANRIYTESFEALAQAGNPLTVRIPDGAIEDSAQ